MYGRLRQVTPAELQRIQSNPETVEQLINGQTDEAAAAETALERVKRLVTEFQMSAKAADPKEQEKLRSLILSDLKHAGIRLPGDTPQDGLSIEKSWHIIHYLLTGKVDTAPPPFGNVIMGGEEIGEERDYGRFRFLAPLQVREVARA